MAVGKKSFRQYTIPTSFGTMHTLEHGSGKPVIFFHGWSVDGWAAELLVRELAKEYRVIVPTMPGSYPSFAWKRDVERHHFEKALSEWYDAIRVSKPVVIGHSLGGVLAMILAHNRQKAMSRLILIDTVGASTGRTSKQWAKAWLNKRAYTYRKYKTQVPRLIDRGFIKNAVFRTRDLIQLSSFARKIDLTEYAAHIHLPVTILWGKDDTFTPPSIGRALQRQFSSCTFTEVPGNHDWPLFDPKYLREHLT